MLVRTTLQVTATAKPVCPKTRAHQATAAEVSIATAVPMGPTGGKGSDPAEVREVEATVVGAAEEVPRNNNVLQVSTKGMDEAQL